MFDVVTYALLKKTISQAATGIEKVEYKDGKYGKCILFRQEIHRSCRQK